MMQTNYASTTTYFVGNHYELENGIVTKYYGVYPELVEGQTHNVLRCSKTAH